MTKETGSSRDSSSYRLHRLVAILDRRADQILRSELGISYKRCLFLVVLEEQGPMTQHELAVCLGYTDPAVSAMLVELTQSGYVIVDASQEHKRKRIVSLNSEGARTVAVACTILEDRFSNLMDAAGVNAEDYGRLTEQICRTLISKAYK